ncbi:MAG: LuxR C-terminal-related transcriptional regulator [Planctomycetaceae bacterium]|jgi:RNA polymerase sigma factor (sigma-70 family)|nr:LuxR C-terminal-related transcriptional regulator [Planctomycetaceae bacterium]
MSVLSDDELKLLLDGIQNQNKESFEQFWNLHFDRLTALARRKMTQVNKRVSDEEDIAISAIHSFYTGLAEQRFHSIQGNNELWKILATIVCRKISKQQRDQLTQKRGGGHIRGESIFVAGPAANNDESKQTGLGNVAGNTLTPYFEIEFLDTCEKLYNILEDETMRNIARLIMEGFSIDEIAEELGCVRRTVERKLKKIREKWQQQEIENE